MKALAVGVLLVSSAVLGQGAEQPHRGMFVSGDFAAGFSGYSEDSETISGLTLGPDLEIGAMLTEHLSVGGRAWARTTLNPYVSTPMGSATVSGSVTMLGLGPELDFAPFPGGAHLFVALGLSQVWASFAGQSVSTQLGYAMQAGAQKDFHLSPTFALGIAAHAGLSVNPDAGAVLTGLTGDVALALTFQ